MNNQERYQDAVHRLAERGYEVFPDGQGYIARCLVDSIDVSRMRHLDDLVEFAGLMEWAEQRRISSTPNEREQEA